MRNTLTKTLATLLFGAALTVPAVALADAPPLIPLQGTLYNADGEPITGNYPVDITLYADEAGTTSIWSDTVTVTFAGGHFTLYLGEHDPLNTVVFRDYDEVYVGIAVDGDAEMPVFAIATSPYAAYANYCGDAETLGGRDASTLLDEAVARTDMLYATTVHSHPWTDITGVPADLADGDDVLDESDVDAYVANNGYLTSVAWGSVTGIPAGFADGTDDVLSEATVDGYVSNNGYLNSGSAVGWSQLTGVPGGFSDGVDNDSVLTEAEVDAYVANNGYLTSVPSVSWADITGIPADIADGDADTDTDTTYSAGTGLRLDGTTFSLDAAAGYAVATDLAVPHSDTSGWTQLLAGGSDDNCTAVTPIGFTFSFFGEDYTQFSVSTNGAVYLGPTCQRYDLGNNALPHSTTYPAIFALQGDMYLPSGATIRYQSTGTTGSRVLTVVWTEIERLGDGTGGARVLVSLHEASGRIDVHYENVQDTPNSRGAQSVIGIQGAGGTTADHVEVARLLEVIDHTRSRSTVTFAP